MSPSSTVPTDAPSTYPQEAENVAALCQQAYELAEAGRDRTKHADTRAAGLAVVANGLLALSAGLNGRVADFRPSDEWHYVVATGYVLALVLLLIAGVEAARALRLTAAPAFRPTDLARYRGLNTQRASPLELRRVLLRGWIATVHSETLTYDAKVRRMARGYRFFAAALVVLVAVVGRMAV
jgi:hypothetical protein